MMDFSKYFAARPGKRATPQSEPIPGSAQVPNSAGGYAWELGPWERLDRFLVLGSEGGTYYIGERPLTVENARSAAACIAEDGERVVRRVVEISGSGRAPKNDPALFVLAMAAGGGDEPTRRAALAALPEVARTGTHLFHWLHFVRAFRGWGRGVRRAVAGWYTGKDDRALAYQLLKYPSRDGWSHRDALRLAHPKPATAAQAVLFQRAVTRKPVPLGAGVGGIGSLLAAVDELYGTAEVPVARAAALIREHRLTREMVPTHLLNAPEVWEALLVEMPLTALIRNLGVLSRVGLLTEGSEASRSVVARLTDEPALRRARVHPVQVLVAMKTYAQGRGMRGKNRWDPVARVVDALDAAFYLAFGAVEPSGKRTLLALDVSGSMGDPVHGLELLSCREAAAAMALVTAATEPEHRLVAFTAGSYPSLWGGMSSGLTPLAISPRQRLDDVVRTIGALPFGGTDCALPMVEAAKHGWKVDLFVVYTDNETWAGEIHPAQALRRYREATGIPAKLVVVGMASNGFSIADPEDAGMMDVVGFDTAAPRLISEFAR
jgi:60 kDa SS-A/Ro ribonucleoprotein